MLSYTVSFLYLLLIRSLLIGADQHADAIIGAPTNEVFVHQHDAYIDRRIRANPHHLANHGSWYERHHLLSPSSLRVAAVDLSPVISTSTFFGTADSTKTLESAAPISRLSHHSNSFHLLAMTEATNAIDVVDDDADWDLSTERACISAIAQRSPLSADPSGNVPCYNVKSLDPLTGSFQADVRVYQATSPTGDWLGTGIEGFHLGLSYAHATVTQKSRGAERRDLDTSWHGTGIEEARHLYRTRSDRAPRRFGALDLAGKVNEAMLSHLKNE